MATDIQVQSVSSGGSSLPRLPPVPMNPTTATWERLEAMRLQRLGLPNKYSRHFNVLRQSQNCAGSTMKDDPVALGGLSREYTITVVNSNYGKNAPSPLTRSRTSPDMQGRKRNSIAPFTTVGKPTCGFFFSRETDNRKIKFGIPPSDLVKWRHFGNSQH